MGILLMHGSFDLTEDEATDKVITVNGEWWRLNASVLIYLSISVCSQKTIRCILSV